MPLNGVWRAVRSYFDWQSILIAIVAITIAFADINYSLILGFFAVPTAIFALMSRLKDSRTKNYARKLFRFGRCILLAISGPAGCAFNTYRTEATLQPVILELDGYFIKYGKFPETLAELAI